MGNAVFTNAAHYKRLICALKKAGYTSAPTYDEALNLTLRLGDTQLTSWLKDRDDHEQIEQMLLLQWQG